MKHPDYVVFEKFETKNQEEETVIQRATIKEGVIEFDRGLRLIMRSPHFPKDQGPRQLGPVLSPMLILLLNSVGLLTRKIDLYMAAYPNAPITGKERNVGNNVWQINRSLGIKPTEDNPSGQLIRHRNGAGYYFAAP